MQWKEYYRERLMTADEAVQLIKSGDKAVSYTHLTMPTKA